MSAYVGASKDLRCGPGECRVVVGIWDPYANRGGVAVAGVRFPEEVGRRRRGRLGRVARKLARSKALRKVASRALRKAGRVYGGKAVELVDLAKTATRAARKLEHMAVREANGRDEIDLDHWLDQGGELPDDATAMAWSLSEEADATEDELAELERYDDEGADW